MKNHFLPCVALASCLAITGCERKVIVVERAPATPVAPIPKPVTATKTLETSRLRAAIDVFERDPSAGNQASVKKALAELDGEIAELQEYVAKHDGDARAEAAAKLQNLQTYRAAETVRFTAAQAKGAVGIREPADARTGADKVEDSAKKVGNTIEDAARKTGDAIKDVVR